MAQIHRLFERKCISVIFAEMKPGLAKFISLRKYRIFARVRNKGLGYKRAQ